MFAEALRKLCEPLGIPVSSLPAVILHPAEPDWQGTPTIKMTLPDGANVPVAGNTFDSPSTGADGAGPSRPKRALDASADGRQAQRARTTPAPEAEAEAGPSVPPQAPAQGPSDGAGPSVPPGQGPAGPSPTHARRAPAPAAQAAQVEDLVPHWPSHASLTGDEAALRLIAYFENECNVGYDFLSALWHAMEGMDATRIYKLYNTVKLTKTADERLEKLRNFLP